jgi:hypothetical protein
MDTPDREVGPHPADPTKPCPFGDLPLDLWEHIAVHLVDSNSTDFVICTTNAVNKNSDLPLCPLEQEERIDHIVRGIPCNGDLYLLEVESDHQAFLGEHHRHGRVLVDEVLSAPDPTIELPEGIKKNGEWYSHIHRDEHGKVDKQHTPSHRSETHSSRHRFFKDVDGTVKLYAAREEEEVVHERHRNDEIEITSAEAYGQWAQFNTNLAQRGGNILSSDEFNYIPIPNATAGKQTGKLTLMSVCRDLKVKANIEIVGKLPMLTRLKVHNPDDEYANMTTPFNLKTQMRYSLDKWLAVVPLKWIAAQQYFWDCDCGEYIWREDNPTIPSREALGPRGRDPVVPVLPWNLLWSKESGHSQKTEYENTSFAVIAVAMVFAFFSTSARYINLFSDKDTMDLLDRALKLPMFKTEYSLTGPHVVPALEGESLRVSKTSRSASAFNLPEMDLMAAFDGEL